MKIIKSTTNAPLGGSFGKPTSKDEWEDWEDSEDEARRMGHDTDGLLIDIFDDTTRNSSRPTTNQSFSRNTIRHSIQKPTRVKSRARQRAQNAKAGIKLVTDMSNFSRPVPVGRKPKFVDAVALHALEGKPTSASIGSFSWLKQKPGNSSGVGASDRAAHGRSPDLSPEAQPIVIGMAVPSDNLLEHQVSPQTAVLETQNNIRENPSKPTPTVGNPTTLPPQHLRSVWSPDTEASLSPYQSSRATSSFYSQPGAYGSPTAGAGVPPVPALPADLKSKSGQITWLDLDDDDSVGTPCTLFEEDGSPTATRKSAKPQATVVSPDSANRASRGWWDHVTTPFLQQAKPFPQPTQDVAPSPPQQEFNPFKKQTQEVSLNRAAGPQASGIGADGKSGHLQLDSEPKIKDATPIILSSSSPVTREWWDGINEKGDASLGLVSKAPIPSQKQQQPQQLAAQFVVTSSRAASPAREETRSEKAAILLEENQRSNETPPPYSPQKQATQVKYGVILPPGHVASSQRVPSPGPATPALPGTMTSQGAIGMAEIPLTPSGVRPVQTAVLPDRAPGSYIPGDHFFEIRGQANRTERQRRRHEKEEVVARKVGGFWRGRGCIPKKGCFGRPGREGRKRRRICLAVIAAIIAAIILATVLGVVLTRRPPQDGQAPSIWLNLTDFPPMPTGVLTVSGPDNTEAISGCLEPAVATTAWSCSLPKEEHDSVAPHKPDQPEFIFQIQYDNNTRALWNISNEDQDSKNFLADEGFKPDPTPPSIADMRFLGNTTDHIEAEEKAGEPTPFFISVLRSINETVGPNALSRRQGFNNAIGSADQDGFNFTGQLEPPKLNSDGTAATAQLFPRPVQQPIRLFDRGLPTEHYGFYTYFDKTIYMADIVKKNSGDEDGGSPISEAEFLVTYAQARFLVQIWTRMENNTRLLGDGAAVPWTNGSSASNTPGTMPYPITITEDVHGGDKEKKIDYAYRVLENRSINTTDPSLVLVNRGFNGTLINGFPGSDSSLGGIDGGTGGCRCKWANFRGLDTSTT